MNSEIDLSGLKDLHYPVLPSFWPLSYGWYVLAGTVLLIILIILYKKKTSPLAYALRELKRISLEPEEKQLKNLSKLLKRVAMARYGREAIAPLSEESWQEFLLAAVPQALSKEEAHFLAYAIHHNKSIKIDKKWLTSSQKWIKEVLKKQKNLK